MAGNKIKKRAEVIYKCLRNRYPAGKTVLKYSTPVQMLVATVLSAQTTDKKVNQITQDEGLFKKYRTVNDFADAKLKTFEKEIRPLGFYKQKAKNIISAARVIRRDFGGKIPKNIDKLILLPGVGRKTANIVLNHVYNIAEGIAVDTHVRQVSRRLGFTQENNPDKIEQDLMDIFPKKCWRYVNYAMVDYNREVSKNRIDKDALLKQICPRAFKN